MVAISFSTVLAISAFFSPMLSLAMPLEVPHAQDSALEERMWSMAKQAGKAAWPVAKQVGKEFMKETITSNGPEFIKNQDTIKEHGKAAAGILQNHMSGAAEGIQTWSMPGGSAAHDDFISKQLQHIM